jgi:hypothetical protein
MKKILLPLVAVAGLIAACVPSVNPFYFDKDVITDARIAGVWLDDSNKDKPESWTFEASTNRAYAVTVVEDSGKTGKLEGHLFKLGSQMFMDLTPTACEYATNQAAITGMAMIPGHLLMRVNLEEKKINLAFTDPDWVKKFLEKNPAAIAHRLVDDNVILTADTAALQKFVKQHLGKDELFNGGGDLKKREK